jgi:hypothetical protein
MQNETTKEGGGEQIPYELRIEADPKEMKLTFTDTGLLVKNYL